MLVKALFLSIISSLETHQISGTNHFVRFISNFRKSKWCLTNNLKTLKKIIAKANWPILSQLPISIRPDKVRKPLISGVFKGYRNGTLGHIRLINTNNSWKISKICLMTRKTDGRQWYWCSNLQYIVHLVIGLEETNSFI